MFSSYTYSNIKDGIVRINGVVAATTDKFPLQFAIITIRTIGNVSFNTISKDRRNQLNRTWNGDHAEILVYDTPLTDEQITQMESYLGEKWGIETI
ncbi:MAG: hypothetical protein HRU07_01260 [Nitrosopumilus sp.]|nr:hypothetical protein [Nitrosopumilus sp.]NRA04802.1 hypothetical protein [Nitrosopumilus sp.]